MSTSSRIAIAALLSLLSTPARTDGIGFNTVGAIDGIGFAGKSGSGPPTCSNSLDLSKACNSANLDLL